MSDPAPGLDDREAPYGQLPHVLLRVLAALAALGVAYLFLLSEPLAYASLGCPTTGGAIALAALPLVALLALYAAAPGLLARLLARRTRVDLRDPAHAVALIVLAGTLFIVLGQGALGSAVVTLEAGRGTCGLGPGPAPTGDAIVVDVLENLAFFALPVLFYVAIVHGKGPAATFRALGLHGDGLWRAVGWGLLAAVAFLTALLLAEAALAPVVPAEYLQNPKAEAIASSVTIGGALVLAVGSALGEEIFFRGFLQGRLGLVATAAIFAVAHVSYGSAAEFVIVLLLALLLGGLYKRTGNLAAPIATHFLFNLLNLLAGIYQAGPS